MRIRRLIVIIVAMALAGLAGGAAWPAAAQAADPAVVARARLDRVQMTVGDWLGYELVVISPANVTSELPPMPTKTLGEWEVRSCAALPPTQVEGGIQAGWQCRLTIWEVGYHALPTQIVKVTNADGSSGRALTQAVAVEVVSVLDPEPVDIKPLKPQLAMSEQANYLLIIGLSLLGLLLAGAIMVGIAYYRKHRPQRAAAPVAPPVLRDPVAVAMAELERIAGLRLVEHNKITEHYTLIADVLRRYIADRFSVPALERTTSEVRAALLNPAALQRRDFLLTLLAEADGVKFARYLPTTVDATAMLEHARQAIMASR